MVFAAPPRIDVLDLPPQVSGAKPKADGVRVPTGNRGLNEVLEDIERQMILDAYEQEGGVKTRVAERLQIKTSALYYKLEKYGIGTVAGRPLGDEEEP
jgi:two-component system response regulator HydG